MEAQKYKNGLEHNDGGNADHKALMLGLVTDEKHTNVHRHRTAQCGKNEKAFFGNSQLDVVQLGDQLVINANNDGQHRHDAHEEQKELQRKRHGILLISWRYP